MISMDDIIRDDQVVGNRAVTLSVRALLRNIILIGQLRRSAVRTELLAAYDGNDADHDFYQFLPRGFEAERKLLASDVEELSLVERVAFIKGASLLLGDRLRARVYCICSMPSGVILPVAAFASILQEDFNMARKTWKEFANIPRLCGEKLRIEIEEGEQFVDLRKLTFEQFIMKITGSSWDLSEVELGRLAAERIEEAFELNNYRAQRRPQGRR
jgi:hypothetical protein